MRVMSSTGVAMFGLAAVLALRTPQAVAQGAAPQAAPAPSAPPAQNIQPLPVNEASGILGRSVHSPDGQDIGRIVDVLVDQNGNPRAAVIDFGGYLGIGNRKIAVDWSAMRFLPGNSDNPVILQMSANEIKSAPQYRENGAKTPGVVAPAAPMNSVAPAAPMNNVAPAAPINTMAPAAPANPAPSAPPAANGQ